ncbi:RNA ligase family protein [Pseudosulfitobacter pseudonitzschiae]|nr:RNA ligase family protein [Pseudosulfitobacter pseudonitzschiae]MBM1834181.1 hypothetical protein [Pseudosulfitobacter pseudonitzschiae]MBM1843894.1 hypothetical protein [Pseudosulfitobacter pseudonitzschiae]MBM1858444.1 hypothetical protein [Pseudosulfitobacter pseudonitzschiae]MBM1863302.1 hypothetical protein [Pseudosulfitobacter pseudonitzschiae]MBM1868134.1 hypothetical protein [Pseudosulfitobacter pseudonitzschiae]
MEFTKYMHLERFGTAEVEGIEIGVAHVFPKIDGTNGSIWLSDDGEVVAGSRNRDLSKGDDNAGFYAWVKEQSSIKQYLAKNPEHILYGEWLVPHSLKTYRDDAWRKFYVFDVMCAGEFIPYEDYQEGLERHGIEYLPLLAKVRNGNEVSFQKCLDKNVFLIKDGEGTGEGVVIKNYGYKNRFGRVVWAKVVTNSFKEKHHKAMGAPLVGQQIIEEKVIEKFVTAHLVQKVHAKIANECEGWSSRYIPRLLNTVWHDLITEESWQIVKEYKNPKIDFGTLLRLCNARVKQVMPELF